MEIKELLPQDFINKCMQTDPWIEILLACAGDIIENKRRELERELELIDKKENMKILEREKRDKELFDVVKYDGKEYEKRLQIIADFGEDKKED